MTAADPRPEPTAKRAARLPEPIRAPAGEPSDAPADPVAVARPAGSGYRGSKDEFHYRGEVYFGSREPPNSGHGSNRAQRAAPHDIS